MTEDVLRALDSLEGEIAMIATRSEAAAARLHITALEDRAVLIDGAAVSGETARVVSSPIAIEIPGKASIMVTPATARPADAKLLDEKRATLRDLLKRHDVENPASLRARRAERRGLEQTAVELAAQRKAMGVSDQKLAAEIDALDIAIQRIDTETSAPLPDAGPLPETLDAIERELSLIAEQRGELNRERASLSGAIEALTASLSDMDRLSGELAGQRREIENQLAADRLTLPEEMRESLLSEARALAEVRRQAHRTKAVLLEERRAAAPAPEDLEALRIRVERLSKAQDNRQQAVAELRQRIARLEGQIEQAGGDGLGERAAGLQAGSGHRVEGGRAPHRTRRDPAAAAPHRRGRLPEAARGAAGAARAHIRPFLHDVFPRAELELGDGFSVSSLKRQGPSGEVFDRLSRGTQEQIAVLVRLAMGALIREKGMTCRSCWMTPWSFPTTAASNRCLTPSTGQAKTSR